MKITRWPVRLIIPVVVLTFLWGGTFIQPIPLARAQGIGLTHVFKAPNEPSSSQSLPCSIFPANNIWNTPVDTLPVDAHSKDYINSIGANTGLHADFGSGTWNGTAIGIPYNVVSGSSLSPVNISFDYDDESDKGPYPFPANPLIEGGTPSDCEGDCHVLVVDKDNCLLYETWNTHLQDDGTWTAGSGAIFDLKSNLLRKDGWTSADAAGLPILAGLVRYDEVASGHINHALRFTVSKTRNTYVWPARHQASNNSSASVPPMGQRFRLKASFDISGYPSELKVILQALKTYGMIIADNGSNWFITGAPDEGWDNDILHRLGEIKGSNFEAVDVSGMQVSPNSAEAQPLPPPVPGIPSLVSPANSAVLLDNPTLTWSAPTPAADHYEIQIASDSGFKTIVQHAENLTGTQYTPAPELTHNQKYYWRIDAVNANGAPGPWSKARSFSIAPATPGLLLPANSSTVNSLRPAFDWSDSPGASRYLLLISKDETFQHLAVKASVSSSNWTASKDLPRLATLWWRVRATSSIGTSNWSSTGTFRTPDPPSVPALSLPKKGASVKTYAPLLDWKDSTNNPLGYQVQISLSKSNFSAPLLDTTSTDSTTNVPADLLSGGVYYWRVRSFNNNTSVPHYSNWSSVSYFRTPAALKGTVRDAATQTPLSGLTVTVDGTTLSAVTDSNGQYLLLNVPTGTRRLQVSGNGYSGAGKVKASTGVTRTLDFSLAPAG
jgi:hypothetical protein